MNNELSMEDLYNQYTSPEQIKNSFEKRTVATGRYTFQATKAEARTATEQSPWPNRPMGNFFGSLKNDDGKRVGSIGFDASWQVHEMTTSNGHKRQDGPSSLWGQLTVALGMEKSSVADVIQAAAKYPLSIYVTEAFQNPTDINPATGRGKWVTANTQDDRTRMRKEGWESRNFVRSISRVK